MSNSLDPDQDQRYVGPDLDPNCLQRLSTDGTCQQTVNVNGILLRLFPLLHDLIYKHLLLIQFSFCL